MLLRWLWEVFGWVFPGTYESANGAVDAIAPFAKPNLGRRLTWECACLDHALEIFVRWLLESSRRALAIQPRSCAVDKTVKLSVPILVSDVWSPQQNSSRDPTLDVS